MWDEIQYLRGDLPVRIGAQAQNLNVISVAGHKHSFTFEKASKPSILYVFSPQCYWCSRNEENVKVLATQVGSRYRWIFLSLDTESLDNYLRSWWPGLQAYHSPDRSSRQNYGLRATPNTFLVNADGTFAKIWSGAWSGDKKVEIEGYFHVTLPGLTPIAAKGSEQQQYQE